jgi:hypothetical protein
VNEPDPVIASERRTSRPVFVSYATADRKQALAVCAALERRGTDCWISTRDVAPGENYQEAIVRALRNARAMVLVFSKAANDSDEIKKELSLASRYRVPVLTLRIEDVEPSDAFAYELSTRQWIDAFVGYDRSIDLLAGRIGEISGSPPAGEYQPASPLRPGRIWTRPLAVAGIVAFALILAAALWFFNSRSLPAGAHPMEVRLAGFKLLSNDLPATLPDAVGDEVIAAFNKDGVVGVSTAPAPPSGSAPAFALGGTIQRDGDAIRVIARLTNERSGTTVWSNTFSYDGRETAAVGRHVAVDAGNVVRCGLFGASTYRKPLPENVLKDYLQFCQWYWDPNMVAGRKALVPAQRVVAAVPDFSWGWAAVAGSYWKVAFGAATPQLADEARASGRQAADRAVAIDPRNSEAFYIKAVLLDRNDWLGREALFKKAVGARRLDCGCEHHQYGSMLANVGRIADGVDELRAANDTLALYVYTPLSLAEVLTAASKPDEARQYYDAASQLAPSADFAQGLTAYGAAQTGDLKRLADPALPIAAPVRSALIEGFRAVASGNPAAKAAAVKALVALTTDEEAVPRARLLAKLGASAAAFDLAAQQAAQSYPGPSVFWYPEMRPALDDPRFLALAQRLGLMTYWKQSKTRPDVCQAAGPPAFCRAI